MNPMKDERFCFHEAFVVRLLPDRALYIASTDSAVQGFSPGGVVERQSVFDILIKDDR
jgi:hypothetical protein